MDYEEAETEMAEAIVELLHDRGLVNAALHIKGGRLALQGTTGDLFYVTVEHSNRPA